MSTRYIDLTTDFGFKRLFGRQENSAILQAFLTVQHILETATTVDAVRQVYQQGNIPS